MSGDLLAYVVPSWQAGITNEHPESACQRRRTQPECLADPECGWCSADEVSVFYLINILVFYQVSDLQSNIYVINLPNPSLLCCY